jgi:hypothetical protein
LYYVYYSCFINSKIHYYYTLFCLIVDECEIPRVIFFTRLFDESESDIELLEHCENCGVTPVDISLSDVWVEILRGPDVRSFFIGLLAEPESDIESLEHCEDREVTPANVSLLDDWVETLRENVDVRS